MESDIKFCEQVIGYRQELVGLQKNQEIPNLPIKAYLVCSDFSESHKGFCRENDVIPIQFSPYELLKNYYFKVKAITKLISLKPSNHGLWNLNLLNRVLYSISSKKTLEGLAEKVGLSNSTVGSYLRLSTELGLTRTKPQFALTDLGLSYVSKREQSTPIEYISDEQTEVLKEYITQNPFFSPAIFGIYSAVETIFALSKNSTLFHWMKQSNILSI